MYSAQVPEPSVGRARTILERVFVPVDFSMESHRAVGVALALQRSMGARVCLFHVAQPDATNDFLGGLGSSVAQGDFLKHAEDRLLRFVDNLVPGYPGKVETRASIDPKTPRYIREEARR